MGIVDIRPLYIKLPQMTGYAKYFDSNKTKSFKVNDNKLFKKYTLIWGKVISLTNVKFDSEPVHGDSDKFIKTKTKSYRDNVNTNFQEKKGPKENASCKSLSLKMLDSVWIIFKHFWKSVNMK